MKRAGKNVPLMTQIFYFLIWAFFLIGLGGTGAFMAHFIWEKMEERDAAFQEAVERYEECVKREYGRMPSAFYQEHGYYPDCPSEK